MNLYDYVGTMEHEIGHARQGFISGVDIIDTNNFSVENAIITPLGSLPAVAPPVSGLRKRPRVSSSQIIDFAIWQAGGG